MGEIKTNLIDVTRELTGREKAKIITATPKKLDEIIMNIGDKFDINIDYVATVQVSGIEMDDGTDTFKSYYYVSKEGDIYSSSSDSLYRAVTSIIEVIQDEGDTDDIIVQIFGAESKNFKGRPFFTANLI